MRQQTTGTPTENRQLERMLDTARTRLGGHTPEEVAQNSSARWENGAFCLRSLGQEITVRMPECEAVPPLSKWHLLTLLHYLDLADGTPPSGRPMSFSRHRDGLVRGGGFDRDAENILRERLGILPPEELRRRCEALGAVEEASNADLCMRFDVFPHYPVWLKIWFADEEFPAAGRLLLDESAPHDLSIEDAVTVGSLLLDRLSGRVDWNV